jgi:hypothetical protein
MKWVVSPSCEIKLTLVLLLRIDSSLGQKCESDTYKLQDHIDYSEKLLLGESWISNSA